MRPRADLLNTLPMPSPNPLPEASASAADAYAKAQKCEVVLPHTAPFRLVDRIVAVDLAGGCLVAERLVTCNDALWPAESQHCLHFFSAAVPKSPTGAAAPAAVPFPPPLIIEALCQAAACLNSLSVAAPAPTAASGSAPAGILPVPLRPQLHHGYLVAITDMKFPAFAYVGDTLTLKVEQKERRGPVIAFAAQAFAAPKAPLHLTPAPDQAGDQPREVASGRLLFAVTLP